MPDDFARKPVVFSDEITVAKAHAVYTPSMLSVYDLVVHGVSNRLAWRCPTRHLLELYRVNLSTDHLEAGVGSGFFLDRATKSRFDRLMLIDINHHCLERSARRLARFHPEVHEVNLLAPIELALPPFASVGLTYVLHCLPGTMSEKLAAVDYLRPLMRKCAVLFGATILGRDIAPNLAARTLLDLYNAKGVFNNRDDDLDGLSRGLRQRFDNVEIVIQGLVAMFRAT